MQTAIPERTFDLTGLLTRARAASRTLARADRDGALSAIAESLLEHRTTILAANAEDVSAERAKGMPEPLIDRLTLTETRLQGIADAVRQIVTLPDPLNRTLEEWTLPNGVEVKKTSVPFGVIGMVYESRPNVTVDAAVLALKAGSAAVLRGSANALSSNRALVAAMRGALGRAGLPADAVQLIDSPDRALVT